MPDKRNIDIPIEHTEIAKLFDGPFASIDVEMVGVGHGRHMVDLHVDVQNCDSAVTLMLTEPAARRLAHALLNSAREAKRAMITKVTAASASSSPANSKPAGEWWGKRKRDVTRPRNADYLSEARCSKGSKRYCLPGKTDPACPNHQPLTYAARSAKHKADA